MIQKKMKIRDLIGTGAQFRMSEAARAVVREKQITVRYSKKKEESKSKRLYSKMNKVISLQDGYDLLENYFVVKNWTIRKYKVTGNEIEVLLYFFPKGYFLKKEFCETPISDHNMFYKFIDNKFIEVGVKDKRVGKTLYRLSVKGKTLVRNFYHFLSGEWKVIEYAELRRLKINTKENQLLKIIKQINSKEPSESKKKWHGADALDN